MYVQETLLNPGVPGLESVLAGLPAKTTIIVAGAPGTGKTTLCKQFLFQGLRDGQPAIMVLTNENKEELVASMRGLGMNASQFFEKNLFKLIDVYSWTAGTGREEKGVIMCGTPTDLNDISLAISNAVSEYRNHPVKRLAFDNFTTLLFHNPSENIIKFFEILKGRLDAEGFTSLFVVEEGPHAPQVMASLEAIADGSMALKRLGEKRFLEVPKIRGLPAPMGRTRFEITNKGIVVLRK